jgi:hypothetical protein
MMDAAVILRDVLQLPFTTAECDEGPVLEHRPGRVTLKYDAEGEQGVVWTVVTFLMALAARFTPEAACEPWMVGAYSKVCELEESSWFRDLRYKAAERGRGLPASARHFVVYFDHVGCWEMLADDLRLNE